MILIHIVESLEWSRKKTPNQRATCWMGVVLMMKNPNHNLNLCYRAPISTLSDTGAKPFDDNDAPKSNDTSSGSDEEEMEVQHWRKEKFLCEEYIRSTMVGYR